LLERLASGPLINSRITGLIEPQAVPRLRDPGAALHRLSLSAQGKAGWYNAVEHSRAIWQRYCTGLRKDMSSRRRRRRADERRLAKATRRTPITIGTIVIIVIVALAVGLARTL